MLAEQQETQLRLCSAFVQSFSVFLTHYTPTRDVSGLEVGAVLGHMRRKRDKSGRGIVRSVFIHVYIYKFYLYSCLEILLQIEMSLQMQEHSVPMQL